MKKREHNMTLISATTLNPRGITSRILVVFTLLTALSCQLSWAEPAQTTDTSVANPTIRMVTNQGDIELVLFQDKAPVSVENFLTYVEAKHYEGTVFHRVINGFMVQGGGYTKDGNQRATLPEIINEARNGLKNTRGTLAMARRRNPDSATSQFFINLVDNGFLDHGRRGFGYAVFGEVTSGMDVVDKIAQVETDSGNWPLEPVELIRVEVLSAD
jgi:peptidyl-prolyl cis-trans isomerase A (cyclophilin A)